MDKEQIEKAASEAQEEMAKRFIQDENFQPTFRNAFKTGAEWRINSVWHKTDERPEDDRTYLAEFDNGTCYMCYNNLYFNRMVNAYHVIRWAYVEDLLPTKGGTYATD